MAEPNENDQIRAIKEAFGTVGVDSSENVQSAFDGSFETVTTPSEPVFDSLSQQPLETAPPSKLEPGFQEIGENSKYITRPIGTLDPITGTTVSQIYFTDEV